MENSNPTDFQSKVFDFALKELVLTHRESFQPLWSVESWAKFLIWVALNCGVSSERESLEFFAESLGGSLTGQMRRLFFERTFQNLALKLIADPADSEILVISIGDSEPPGCDVVLQALDQVALSQKVLCDQSCWKTLEAMIAIPWLSSDPVS